MSKTEFSNLVNARYPLVYIVSTEESRVLREISEVGSELGLGVSHWSITRGLTEDNGQPTEQCNKPSEILASVEQLRADGIIVLKDFDPYFQDPVVVRALRDCVESYRAGQERRTLVILASELNLPEGVRKSAAVVDWALPTREDLARLVNGFCGQVNLSVPVEPVIDALLGLTHIEAENALAKSFVAVSTLDPKLLREEKKQEIRKSGMLEYYETDESAATVGGVSELKAWNRKRRRAFSAQAREYGLRLPKGCLVVGPPGTGKSLSIKAMGNDWGFPVLCLDIGKIFSGLVGSSESNVRTVIKVAEAMAPCILWIDEIEKGFGGSSSDGGTSSRVFGTFLTWLQEKKSAVFVGATANAIDALPPELLRKGRFDEIFFVDLPSESERAEIVKIHLRKVGRSPDSFDVSAIAQATDGYSGAEIEETIVSAMFDAFDADREFTTEDILNAKAEIVPLSKTAKGQLDKLRKWAATRCRKASQGQHGALQEASRDFMPVQTVPRGFN